MAMVKNKSTGSKIFNVCNILFFALIMIVCILPVWHVFCASFSNASWVMNQQGLIWRIEGFNVNGYKLVFTNNNIWTGYLNTFIYVIGTTVLGMFLTVMAAYALSRKDFIWANPLMLIISFTMLFNGGMVPTYMVVRNLGLYNSRWAVIIPSAISVFNLIIMRTGFMEVPASLEESAKLDGASEWTIMFRIIVPLSKATIAVILLYYAVGIWNSWFPAMIYLKDREKFPLQLILREILLLNDTSVMTSSADAVKNAQLERKLVKYCTIVVSTVPIMCFYPFIQKYFTKGVMIGAVKG